MLLIPYHAAMAWNVWEEPNYIFFHGNKVLSSLIVFFSPYYMPLLFLLAGISTKYALRKRTYVNYMTERAKRLLIPLLFGTLFLMPVMTYIADKYNYGYSKGFLAHYAVFFTKYTDLTGADGGFSFGQFWFLLYLFMISTVAVFIIEFQKKYISKAEFDMPFWLVVVLGVPLPLLSQILSVGGKSFAEYLYIFLLGYYFFSNDIIIDKAVKYKAVLLFLGLSASIFNVYLFIWSETKYHLLNTITNFTAEWFMLLSLMGIGKRNLDFTGKLPGHMSEISFSFFSFHFVWVVLLQYIFSHVSEANTVLLNIIPVISAYLLTFMCCEITFRIPILRFLTGTKCISKNS